MASAPKSFGPSYSIARERYAAIGVDTEAALTALATVSISLHCWQGDDVRGFESSRFDLGGGLAVTGGYPGRARTIDELRSDLEQALKLIPGSHRLNLHAIYGDFEGRHVDRDAIESRHFATWLAWAREHSLGLDFNPSCFAHPLAAEGFTLAHRDEGIRRFWIEHCRRAREIGAEFGRALGTPCVTNVWIPDGYKDTPARRWAPRERLARSLDDVFGKILPKEHVLDAVEPKLFGIGSESYVVGSHEFYLGYAITRQKLFCLDSGHFHPTESIADKISSLLHYVPRLLLHISRGVRWDSDHVVTDTDEVRAIGHELASEEVRKRVHVGMDYFDASINRVAAWVIGTRSLQRAILAALLEPRARIESAENEGDYTTRLALQEEAKAMPVGDVWNEFCERREVPRGETWLREVKRYERDVLSQRKAAD
jgi:L-rhamnose isomerase